MKTLAAVTACLLLAASLATAPAAELDDKVAGRADLTYYDLVKLIVTDLPPADSKGEPSAHDIARYRHIEGKSAKTEPAGPVAVKYVSPLEVHSGGAARVVRSRRQAEAARSGRSRHRPPHRICRCA